MLFWIPLAALIAQSLIYRTELGLRAIGIYWLVWVVGLLLFPALKLPGYAFVALQAFMAAIMAIHVKKNQAGL